MEQQRPLSASADIPVPAGPSLGAGDQSCRECARRKGKCDRQLPECTPCMRNKRHCLYEKSSRSPLTRKHLTAVEERLRQAEARLRQSERRAQIAESNLKDLKDLLEAQSVPGFTHNAPSAALQHGAVSSSGNSASQENVESVAQPVVRSQCQSAVQGEQGSGGWERAETVAHELEAPLTNKKTSAGMSSRQKSDLKAFRHPARGQMTRRI